MTMPIIMIAAMVVVVVKLTHILGHGTA